MSTGLEGISAIHYLTRHNVQGWYSVYVGLSWAIMGTVGRRLSKVEGCPEYSGSYP